MGVNLRYDVYVIGENGDLHRVGESIPEQAQDVAMEYRRYGDVTEIKLAAKGMTGN